jgi:MFS family permease
MILIFCIVSSGSVTNFFPTVVSTLEYGTIETLLLTAPPYVLAVITAMLNAWHADRTGERYFHITLPLYISVAAFIIAATTTGVGPRYLSMMLMVPGVYTGYVVALGWISNTLPRPPAKRAAALAFINAVSNASSIYASYMYPSSAGPRYGMHKHPLKGKKKAIHSCHLLTCVLYSGRHVRQLHNLLYRHHLRHGPPLDSGPAEQEA